ncbi:MAG: large conductance mechanosensitive channel protein MscL [Atopobiaceae bacterium]|nr:large conductance mechanosensitive channel protein MscL [Atopobiaceae bacterium]MDO4404914.1 large conductance mechanosensitive channel protein MscL [Atopobiaceae bacterium]
MSKYMDEFKEFISQGNVMDMAVGVIIGGAFTGIVTALTDDIINPIISLVGGGSADFAGLCIPGTRIDVGSFISAVINFLIIAFVVFNLVKGLNKIKSVTGLEKAAEEEAPAPTCPHCLEEVKEGATRCPHCAGEIPGGAKA